MRLHPALAITVWLFTCSLDSRAEVSPKPLPPTPSATLPKLTIARSILDNDVRVVLAQDHANPTIAVCVAHELGARNEDLDREGLARLLALSSFHGDPQRNGIGYPALIHSRGGVATSSTTSDATVLCQSLPKSQLELALWVAADRLKTPRPTPERFEAQRTIAIGLASAERESRGDGSGRAALQRLVFEGFFPYSHAASGSVESLTAARLEDVTPLILRYVDPSLMVLSIAGDFERETALTLARRYFGELPTVAHSSAAAESNLTVPEQTTERLNVLIDEKSLAPVVHYGWRIPPSRSKAHLALELAGEILAGGDGSRLHQSLVSGRGSALGVSAWTAGHAGPDLLGIDVTLGHTSTVDRAQGVLDGELKRLRTVGPSAVEVARAKARVLNALAETRQTQLARASELGLREVLGRDATSLNEDGGAYLAIDADDIRRAAAEYLVEEHRSIVEVYPPNWKQDQARATNTTESFRDRTYKVRKGDSLSAIATRYRISASRLIAINKLDPKKQIIVGQKLSIPTPLESDDDHAATPDK